MLAGGTLGLSTLKFVSQLRKTSSEHLIWPGRDPAPDFSVSLIPAEAFRNCMKYSCDGQFNTSWGFPKLYKYNKCKQT